MCAAARGYGRMVRCLSRTQIWDGQKTYSFPTLLVALFCNSARRMRCFGLQIWDTDSPMISDTSGVPVLQYTRDGAGPEAADFWVRRAGAHRRARADAGCASGTSFGRSV
eukprot:SAG31_NODE_2590_length_5426_cov_4.118265_11_plen_110_part_00